MTREAYGTAFSRGFDRTIAALMARGVRSEEAREYAQAGWAKGWERLNQLRDERCVMAWVDSIAWSLFLSKSRLDAKYPIEPLDSHQALVAPDQNADAAIDLSRSLLVVRSCHREVLDLRLRGFTNCEIAKRSGKSDGANYSRMTRARRALRATLLKNCVVMRTTSAPALVLKMAQKKRKER